MNQTPAPNIHCRPNLNGNTPEQFRQGGRRLHEAVCDLRTVLTEVSAEMFHGRNYQHLPASEARQMRELDVVKIRRIHQWLDQISEISVELYQRGSQ